MMSVVEDLDNDLSKIEKIQFWIRANKIVVDYYSDGYGEIKHVVWYDLDDGYTVQNAQINNYITNKQIRGVDVVEFTIPPNTVRIRRVGKTFDVDLM